MWSFQIRHQNKVPHLPQLPLVGEGFLFETCLRRILIERETDGDNDGLLQGPEAYRFLLETICGLKSPLFGETEILGQFKQFLAQNAEDPDFAFFKPWSQSLLEDAKKIRTGFLQGHASQSYGSLLRKKIPEGQAVTILGAGLLTESILPWLSQNPTSLWVRSPQKSKSKFPSLEILRLDQSPANDTWVLVAAPLQELELEALLGPRPNPWIDLREKAAAPISRAPLFDLKALFSEIQQNQTQIQSLKKKLQDEVIALSAARYEKAWFRPLGWEDLCVS